MIRPRLLVIAFAFATLSHSLLTVAARGQTRHVESSPSGVIQSLYKLHNDGKGPIFTKAGKKYLSRYFDSQLTALIWKEVAGTPAGEVGNLDFDPFYNAQDTQITSFRIGEPRIRRDAATVIVSFKNFGHLNKLIYTMRKTREGWRIHNIDYGGGLNLVKVLSASL